MTFEEINNLTLVEVKPILVYRVLADPTIAITQALVDSYSDTDPDLLTEFDIYKAELTTVEQARLDELARVAALKARFDSVDDIRLALVEMGRTDANIAILKRDIIKDDDTTLLSALEAADVTAKTTRDAIVYISHRRTAYAVIDNELMEALVEKELGDATKWDAYIVKRDAIKVAHPKP